MKNADSLIRITPLQAKTLANLIRLQITAYAEAEEPCGVAGEQATPCGLPPQPFTGSDLDNITPLLERFDLAAD